jgi:hypothetical protein
MYSCRSGTRSAVAVLVVVLSGTAAHTAPSTGEPLDEIVIVANKVARPVRDVAAIVTVLERDDLTRISPYPSRMYFATYPVSTRNLLAHDSAMKASASAASAAIELRFLSTGCR